MDYRLREAAKYVEEVRKFCGVASISTGVLHENKVVFKESVGYRDVEKRLAPDADTAYILASLSKSFTAAAIGILVEDGILAWTDKISKHISNFNPVGNREIAEEADLQDLLRHSAGLSNPVVPLLGPNGIVIAKEDHFVDLVNLTPTTDGEGEQLYNAQFRYSNVGYGLAARIVESASGMRYSDFIRERILKPLHMQHTAVSKADIEKNDNLAFPYGQLDDGTFKELGNEYTDENRTSILGSLGIRSSVNDLLKWASATMEAERQDDVDLRDQAPQTRSGNPLRQMATIQRGWWTRPSDDDSSDGDEDGDDNDAAYCFGWLRAKLPSSHVSWGSYNVLTKRNENVLGKESSKRLMIKHTGMGQGISCALFTFPETQSAVVALSNGLNVGDASDFAAHVLIQALFDLEPKVDFMPIVKKETEQRRGEYHGSVVLGWLENRDIRQPERPIEQYFGDYDGLAMRLSVRRDDDAMGRMTLSFNGRNDLLCLLEYYNKDQYSYLPLTRGKWASEGWLDWDHYLVGVLKFVRDKNDTVTGLEWAFEECSKPIWFQKINKETLSRKEVDREKAVDDKSENLRRCAVM